MSTIGDGAPILYREAGHAAKGGGKETPSRLRPTETRLISSCIVIFISTRLQIRLSSAEASYRPVGAPGKATRARGSQVQQKRRPCREGVCIRRRRRAGFAQHRHELSSPYTHSRRALDDSCPVGGGFSPSEGAAVALLLGAAARYYRARVSGAESLPSFPGMEISIALSSTR